MMKEPCVHVPVHVLLDLIRIYKELPQELMDKQVYLTADLLERKAYRKYLEYKKALRKESK